jgi:hypothetical protein
MKQDRPLDGVLLITQPSHQIIRPMKINSASPKASTCSTDKALIIAFGTSGAIGQIDRHHHQIYNIAS